MYNIHTNNTRVYVKFYSTTGRYVYEQNSVSYKYYLPQAADARAGAFNFG